MTEAEEVMESLLPPRIKIVWPSVGERVRWEDGDCGEITSLDLRRSEVTIRWDKGNNSVHMYGGGNKLPWTYEERSLRSVGAEQSVIGARMTPAEEVMEALLGRLATCICGQPVGCKRDTGIVICVCRRRWVKQMPTDGAWCTYMQIDIRGRSRNYIIGTKSSREYRVEG